MLKKYLSILKLQFTKTIKVLDNVKVVKAFAYTNLIIMFLNFVSYFLSYKLITINQSFHYWFFIFSSVIIFRYVQKNWNNI